MTTKDKIFQRCKDFSNNGKPPTEGLWFNENQFRLEVRSNGEMISFMDLELLHRISKHKDDDLKTVILDHYEPFRTMLLDLFYPGWTINYYAKTTRFAERAY